MDAFHQFAGGEFGQAFGAGDGGVGGVVMGFIADGGCQPATDFAIYFSEDGCPVESRVDVKNPSVGQSGQEVGEEGGVSQPDSLPGD